MNDEGGIMNDEFKDSSLIINIEQLRRRIGVYDRQQILIWQLIGEAGKTPYASDRG